MHSTQRPTKPDLTPPPAPRPVAVQLRARRKPRLIALGVLLVVLGGLAAAALYTMNADHTSALVMASDVRRGEVVERGDVSVIEIPGSLQVEHLSPSDLDALVGQPALTDLPTGSFPLARHVGESALPAGDALVGLKLALGRIPSPEMPVGTAIRIIGLAEGTAVEVPATTASIPSTIDDGLTYAVDVALADKDADTVARLSASDQVAIVVVAS